jgi:hypothetical protein
MAEIGRKHSLEDGGESQPHKKLKLSELPISQAKRSVIDNLIHTFRKKGEYDAMRKQLFTQFEADVSSSLLSNTFRDSHTDQYYYSPRKPLCSLP